MSESESKHEVNDRVSRFRARASASGLKRVEVTVPIADVPLVKALADLLRNGGDGEKAVRPKLEELIPRPRASNGSELVDFLRSSPLAELAEPMEFERDQSTGRDIDIQ